VGVTKTDTGVGPDTWRGEYMARTVARSLNARTGDILTTMHLRLPWYITPELLRHRSFSFSSASTRAVPVKTMVGRVVDAPAMPLHWGRNQKGMQADEELDRDSINACEGIIHRLASETALAVQALDTYGLHKQVANKYLTPWLWCDILVSSTTWANFLALRVHRDAAPEMQRIATMVADELVDVRNIPRRLHPGDWHTPFVDLERAQAETGWEVDWTSDGHRLLRCSAARCARLSTRQGGAAREDWQADLDLARRLVESEPKHASPFEHVAQARETSDEGSGNFKGFAQLRHMMGGNTAKTFIWKGTAIF
jgi:thymidylate synthase ThyX